MYKKLAPLSRDRHARLKLKSPGTGQFTHARASATVAVCSAELPLAVHEFPMTFVSGPDGRFHLLGVLGVKPGENLFVAHDGRWLGRYVPAQFRGYPFATGRTEDGRAALLVDEGSPWLSEDEGSPLFGEDGEPSETTSRIGGFLAQAAQQLAAVDAACDALHRHGLIVPWQVKTQREDGSPAEITGLHRVDEDSLRQAPESAIAELQRTGALQIAYAQIFSMPLMARLPEVAALRQRIAPAVLPDTPDALRDLEFKF